MTNNARSTLERTALALGISVYEERWQIKVFVRAYDLYFVPRERSVVLNARRIVRAEYREFCSTKKIPKWLFKASEYIFGKDCPLSCTEDSVEVLKNKALDLSEIEMFFILGSLDWFHFCGITTFSSIEVLRGIASYTQGFKDNGAVPFFMVCGITEEEKNKRKGAVEITAVL
jgi:hypothetical protein